MEIDGRYAGTIYASQQVQPLNIFDESDGELAVHRVTLHDSEDCIIAIIDLRLIQGFELY